MQSMFNNALLFDQELSSWNTSSIISMTEMFYHASSFNQDISSWDVDQVISCSSIFNSCPISEENKPTFTLCSF
jgi:surface protein